MLSEMKLDQKIEEMEKEGTLNKFIARQIVNLPCLQAGCKFGYSRKQIVSFGTGTSLFAVAVIKLIEYFFIKGG